MTTNCPPAAPDGRMSADPGPPGEPWVYPKKGLRTPAMIWSELPSDHKFPENMPVHPQGHFGKVGLDHVFGNVLTPWAVDRTLDGGGHVISKDSLNKATELGDRGARQNVKCESYGRWAAASSESREQTIPRFKEVQLPVLVRDGGVLGRLARLADALWFGAVRRDARIVPQPHPDPNSISSERGAGRQAATNSC